MPRCLYCLTHETLTNDVDTFGGIFCEICIEQDDSFPLFLAHFTSPDIGRDFVEQVRYIQSLPRPEAVRFYRENYSIYPSVVLSYCEESDGCLKWSSHDSDRLCPCCMLVKETEFHTLPFGVPWHPIANDFHCAGPNEDAWPENLVSFDRFMKDKYSLIDWNAVNSILPCIFYQAMHEYRNRRFDNALMLFQECYIQSFYCHKGRNSKEIANRMYGLASEFYAILSLVMAGRLWKFLHNDYDRCYAYLNTAQFWADLFENRDCQIIVMSELAHPVFRDEEKQAKFREVIEEGNENLSFLTEYFVRNRSVNLANSFNDKNPSDVNKRALEDEKEQFKSKINSWLSHLIEKDNQRMENELSMFGPSSEFLLTELSESQFQLDLMDLHTSDLSDLFFDSINIHGEETDKYKLVLIALELLGRNWETNDPEHFEFYANSFKLTRELELTSYVSIVGKKLNSLMKNGVDIDSVDDFDFNEAMDYCQQFNFPWLNEQNEDVV